jgi:hypothetical protein
MCFLGLCACYLSSSYEPPCIRHAKNLIVGVNYIILSGSAAQRGLWLPRLRGFLITHDDAPQSVGLL